MSPAQALMGRIFRTETDDWRGMPPGQGKSQFMAQIARDLELPLIIVPLADGKQAERIEKLSFFKQRIAAYWDFCPASVREALVGKQLPAGHARRHVAKVLSRLPYEQISRGNAKIAHRVVWQLM